MVYCLPMSNAIKVRFTNNGNTYRATITGRVGSIRIKGEMRGVHIGIDTVDLTTVRQSVTVNRADGKGKSLTSNMVHAVHCAVLEDLETLDLDNWTS